MLQSVKHLVAAGFAIHRLHAKTKRPIGDDWSDAPVASWETLQKTYRKGENLGVRLGEPSKVCGGYLHVLDLDIRDPDETEEALAKLRELFPMWETFPVVLSGSGGDSRHFYLISEKPYPSEKLARSERKMRGKDGKMRRLWEIEFFGTGKQVAMPPSIHPDTGKPYRWLKEFDETELMLDVCSMVPTAHMDKLLAPATSADVDDERSQPLGLSVAEVKELLERIPNADLDYDDWLNVMASVQHECFGRSKEEKKRFFEVFAAWSSLSDKHDPDTTRYKFFSFKNKTNRRHRTMRSIQAEVLQLELDAEFENLDDTDPLDEEDEAGDFDDILGDTKEVVSKRQQKLNKAKVEADLGHVPPKIARLNKKHAVAFINGKTTIITEGADGNAAYGTVGDLHNYYENDRVATEKATEPVTKTWMRHKLRRQYPNGVVFAPGREVKDAYNHWRGFAVEPDPKGSCRLILKHMRELICRGDQEAYDYLIGWFAHMIQRPEEKPGVAVVLRGLKGTGKDTIGDYVGGLFPHNHIKIANADQLTGKFNAHQEKCLMLHVEEGFWAGNKQAESTLKHVITSEEVMIEPKGLNAFKIRSVLRLFISSNERWVVPATEDERRYFVLDVSPERKDDHRYFEALRREMTGGGRAALLHFLQTYDLRKFNVRSVPNTAALAQQKVEGLKNIERWWHGQLRSGEASFPFTRDRGGEGADWAKGPIAVDRTDFRDGYTRWLKTRRFDGEELDSAEVGLRMKVLVPSLSSVKKNVGGSRPRFYILPSLPECRLNFETWIGSVLEWPEIESALSEDEYDNLSDL
ncbi:MAG: hypothetical protein DI537_20445 [Stutzerimonas stutzeri]|nr:MAG: hypothetical protein DI537_20445 [Stutzerimonas stutzeri]